MSARWWAFAIWAAVAASLVYWGLRLFAPAPPLPPGTTLATVATAPRGDLTRLLGIDPPPQPVAAVEIPASSRFQLVGVVASRGAAAQGLALIAVDGKPARTYRVGAAVDGDTVLQTVGQRSAALGPRGGAAAVALDIPPPAPAATGVPMAMAAPQGMPMQPLQQPQVQAAQAQPLQPMNLQNMPGMRPGVAFPQGRGVPLPRQQQMQQMQQLQQMQQQAGQPGADEPPRAAPGQIQAQ